MTARTSRMKDSVLFWVLCVFYLTLAGHEGVLGFIELVGIVAVTLWLCFDVARSLRSWHQRRSTEK